MDAFDPRITEHRNPRSLGLDTLSTCQILELINDEDATVIPAVRREIPNIEAAIDLIVARLEQGGRLFYVGAGTSGRLGVLDATEIPPTYGADPSLVQGIIAGGPAALVQSQEGAEDREDEGTAVVEQYRMTPRDVVFGIAASGTTPFVRGALHAAYTAGIPTILLSCTPPHESLRQWATCCITPITGPEVVTGSTRMKAGTATKLVLNMVTTASMIRLGKVYENLMVDIRASCEKLENRAERILRMIVGVDQAEASRLLDAADDNLKVALVMALAGCEANEAERYLRRHGMAVREAIKALTLNR